MAYEQEDPVQAALRRRLRNATGAATQSESSGTVESGNETGIPVEQGGVTGTGTATVDPTDGLDTTGMGMDETGTTGVPTPTPTPKQTPQSPQANTDGYTAPKYTTAGGNVPAGWDATKWQDQTHQTPKYVVGRILSQYPSTVQGLSQAVGDIQKAYPGSTFDGKDKVTIPGVGTIDVLTGASQGGNGWAWQPLDGLDDTQGTPAAGTTAAANNNPFMNVPSAASANSGGASSSGTDMRGQIQAALMKMMGQDPNSVTSSPIFQNSVSAYDTQQQRAMENQRNAIAERMDAAGTAGSGAYDQALLGAEQQRGENTSNFAAQLAQSELNNQRTQIMQALEMGAGILSDEQKLALTERLGLIDAALRQQSITNQNTQFNDTLGWNMAQWQFEQNKTPFTI